MRITSIALSLLLTLPLAGAARAAPVRVVTTLSTYASIATEVGGDRVEVSSISRGDEDAHFVQPKPSFALLLKRADLFVTTGLDLEIWAPVLVDKSGNRRIRGGGPGYVSASDGVPLLEVPAVVDRSAGDVHIYGNPHIFTNPLNAKIIAANIAAGLERVDPEGAPLYAERLADFERRIDEAVFGAELVELLDPASLDSLARAGTLSDFLAGQELGGRPLTERLGGWLGRARPLAGREIVAYHKNWTYLADLLDIDVVDWVEPKPGIPPSARHVFQLVERIRRDRIPMVLAASYFSREQVEAIAERTGCAAVRVPLGPTDEIPTYFDLVDHWIDRMIEAVERREAGT